MLFGIDYRLWGAIITLGLFIFSNWRSGIKREAVQAELNKAFEKDIAEIGMEQCALDKRIDDALEWGRKEIEDRIRFNEKTYVREQHFNDCLNPLIAQVKGIVDANIPVELAKIQATQSQILVSIKRIDAKIFGGASFHDPSANHK